MKKESKEDQKPIRKIEDNTSKIGKLIKKILWKIDL